MNMLDLVLKGLGETIYMTVAVTFFAYVVGLPLGLVLGIHKGAVGRNGRPVHQLIGLVGAFVKIVDPQIRSI